ncbi:MAG: response regulator transcription factor [Alphaproteobacteria bacterium]|nr:MAG: response regulator transcription factor [Alphaproteobacteria bacterium]
MRRIDPHLGQVYIVDDDALLRRSLSFLLRTTGYSPRAFASGQDFLDAAEALSPGCVLLDVRMAKLDGPSVLRGLDDKLVKFAVITMTGHGDIDTAVQVMKLGSLDFIEKPFANTALLEMLDMAFVTLSEQLRKHALRSDVLLRLANLTPREMDVLRSLVAGEPNKIIAHRLRLSARTVEMHRANLMTRLGVKSLAAAVHLALVAGVIPPDKMR